MYCNYEKILIAGDFNFPNITKQDSHYTSLGTLGQDFCDILDDTILCHNFVFSPPEIQIFLTSNPDQAWTSIDHRHCDPSKFGMFIRFKFSSTSNPVMSNRCLFYKYKRANFDDLRKHPKDIDICSRLTMNKMDSSIDYDWSLWKNAVMTVVHECIPSKLVDPRRSLPWITHSILHQICKRVTAVRDIYLNVLNTSEKSSAN